MMETEQPSCLNAQDDTTTVDCFRHKLEGNYRVRHQGAQYQMFL